VKAVLAQRLFIDKIGLPAALLNQLKRLAAFQNPEFYKKQRMRLYTGTTPRVISCAEDLDQYISLPRCCAVEAAQLLAEHGVTLTIDDQRYHGTALNLQFNGDLTAVQTDAARALLAHDTGVFVAPPGIGKPTYHRYRNGSATRLSRRRDFSIAARVASRCIREMYHASTQSPDRF